MMFPQIMTGCQEHWQSYSHGPSDPFLNMNPSQAQYAINAPLLPGFEPLHDNYQMSSAQIIESGSWRSVDTNCWISR